MLAFPALELRDGQCVQVRAADDPWPDDPRSAARRWAALGFTRLQVVDLDAVDGRGDILAPAWHAAGIDPRIVAEESGIAA